VRKSRLVIVTVIITLVVVAMIALSTQRKIMASRHPTVVHVEEIHYGQLVECVSAPGEIEPKKKVEISAKVSARIVQLPYEEGDRVTCGDPDANPPVPASVLIRLDARDLESRLRSAEANRAAQAARIEVEKATIAGQQSSLAGLAASLKQARQDLQRQQALLQSRDISQSAFDQAELRVDDLKAQHDAAGHALQAAQLNLKVLRHNLEAADAGIAQAREALTYTTITSPIDGVVTRINAEVGEVVVFGTMNNPGTVIMRVADLSQMLVVAQIDEADVGKLKVGQKATVYIDAFPNSKFTGIVKSVALSHDMSYSRTKYFRTEILLDETQQKLYSGLTAHVDIQTRSHSNVLKVPTQAVLGRKIDTLPLEIRDNCTQVDTTKNFVTIVYRYNDGKAVATPVKIGQSDLTHTIILEGLKEKDKVVVGPYKVLEKLKHGQKIQDEREVQKKDNEKDAEAQPDQGGLKDDSQQ